MLHFRLFILSLSLFIISACTSTPTAPVIERSAGQTSKVMGTKSAKNKATNKSKDWRPDTYTVKKGDTLYSIGLEFGYDYKEVAATNNINAPYSIKIGQQLKLGALKDKTGDLKNTDVNTENNVVITPMKSETVTNTPPKTTLVISEPKATHEPYSIEAMNKPSMIISSNKVPEIKPTETKPTEIKTAESNKLKVEPKSEVKPDLASDEDPEWAWPTQGKVVTNFNEGSNKGIDIAGVQGQAINASASGKVIYSGSDLRSYGKLVIIKHNKTYLSVYAHNSKILVKEGQLVTRGQKIAEMGNTDSDKVALHFEIRQQGKSVDPTKFVSQ